MAGDLLEFRAEEVASFPPTRRSLVLRAKGGEAEAANELAALYRAPLLAWLRRQGNPAEAEDVAQETLNRILVTLRVLELVDFTKGRFRNLIIGVAKNVLREGWRSGSKETRIDAQRLQDWSQAEDPDTAFQLERARSIATGAVEVLRSRHPAEYFVYRHRAEGRSYEEIGKIYEDEHRDEPRHGAIGREFIDNRHRRAREVLRRTILERLWQECANAQEVREELELLKPYLAQVWPFPSTA